MALNMHITLTLPDGSVHEFIEAPAVADASVAADARVETPTEPE